jgi:hypothetical protein
MTPKEQFQRGSRRFGVVAAAVPQPQPTTAEQSDRAETAQASTVTGVPQQQAALRWVWLNRPLTTDSSTIPASTAERVYSRLSKVGK